MRFTRARVVVAPHMYCRYPEMMATQEVAIVTYADFVAIEGLGNRDCFLLKLDLEG